MKKLIIMQGLPASGKSFWAKNYLKEHEDEKWIIVNRDAIRDMLNPNKWTPELEKLVRYFKRGIAVDSLCKGFNVIIDETNLTCEKLEEYRFYAEFPLLKEDVEVIVARVSTPYQVCFARNSGRDERHRVPKERMQEMLASFEKEIPDGYKLIEASYIYEK